MSKPNPIWESSGAIGNLLVGKLSMEVALSRPGLVWAVTSGNVWVMHRPTRPSNPVALVLWLLRRRRALRRYLKILPPRLAEDYCHAGPYTPGQVEAALRRNKLEALGFDAYALAIFCDREAAERLWRVRDVRHDHAALRKEVGRVLFNGAADFTVRDIKRFSSRQDGFGSDGGGDGASYSEGHHGGGHHGGDGGHH